MEYYLLLLCMTLLGSIASFFLKKVSVADTFKSILTNSNLYIGFLLYFFSALLNIYILRFLDYSVVLPLTSFTYIWTLILSYYYLHENISALKIIGVCLIIIGAVVVSW